MSPRLGRIWTMVAHYHGQFWNGAQIGRSLGVSETTARRYLDILAGSYMVRILPPWFENLKKRQVKAPKAYLRDSGVLHALLGLKTPSAVHGHPKLGASWEGFAVKHVLAPLESREADPPDLSHGVMDLPAPGVVWWLHESGLTHAEGTPAPTLGIRGGTL